ncbi:MAG: 4-hydroxymandelate oxidase [Bryobacterales bacterium]|jgi:isopentenyl diphosphate isomerase/L-lactate dehydrogenase-like FMN-dependent dehydrogenase|nr:4-hydroxymandelate oxidase [Bryobacterales bacterium]
MDRAIQVDLKPSFHISSAHSGEVLNRRESLRALGAFLAGSPLLAQQDPLRDHTRVPGLNELLTAFDFEAVAYTKQPRAVYDYRAYGSDSEFTLRRNREAFEWVELIPKRVVAGPVSTACEVFGTKMAFPLIVSPTAAHGELHPEGELATHKGALAAASTPMILSNNTSFPFDKVVAAAGSPMWVQLYPKQQLEANRSYLESAQAAGAKAVVVTIDQQVSYYERSLHDRNLNSSTRGSARGPGMRPTMGNPYRVADNRLWYEWKFFDEIRPFVKVPMIAKGVVTPEDAKLCLEHGVDGVYVSNHGGRSLDYGPSTLEVLPEIVDAVHGRVPVLFDSGIRRGSDILKALALGASAVCIGRVPLWGLGSFGAAGVQRVLEILQAELVQAMQYTGCTTLASVDRKMLLTNFP